jgi:hypothetical protein
MKIVYLPDLSRPMAMKQSVGLFGTAEMKPVLQDGWMLTSLDASADSKVSETLSALASIAGTAMGTSTGTKAKGVVSPPGGGPASLTDLSSLYERDKAILRPGLYRFVYSDGVLTGIAPVAFFTGTGVVMPVPEMRFPR